MFFIKLRSVIKNALTREDPEFFAMMVRLYNTARTFLHKLRIRIVNFCGLPPHQPAKVHLRPKVASGGVPPHLPRRNAPTEINNNYKQAQEGLFHNLKKCYCFRIFSCIILI